MANCTYCNSFILFGGSTDQTGRYCNTNCHQAGYLMNMSRAIPPDILNSLVEHVHRGPCPTCGRPGPVDVHKAYQVWSALVLTSWSSKPEISCKRCATQRQIGAAFFSGALGWWGIPWGLVMTPFQISRNLIDIFGGPRPSEPSPLLRKFVALQAAAQGLATPSMPPPLPGAGPPPIPQSGPPPLFEPLSIQETNDDRYRPR